MRGLTVENKIGQIYAYRPDSGDLLLVIDQMEFSFELFNMQTGASKWRSLAWLEECVRLA